MIFIFHTFVGWNYELLVVTCNRQVFGKFERHEAVKAFICHFGIAYVYGLNFEKGTATNKKSSKKEIEKERDICNFFNFWKEIVLGIEEKRRTPTGKTVKKRTSDGVTQLKSKIKDA